jgi:hypothetical protein
MDVDDVEVGDLVFERSAKVAGIAVRSRPPDLKVPDGHAVKINGAVGWDVKVVRAVDISGEDRYVVAQSHERFRHA